MFWVYFKLILLCLSGHFIISKQSVCVRARARVYMCVCVCVCVLLFVFINVAYNTYKLHLAYFNNKILHALINYQRMARKCRPLHMFISMNSSNVQRECILILHITLKACS